LLLVVRTAFFTVDAEKLLGQGEDPPEVQDYNHIIADVWSCGRGLNGGLGNGKWTHVQETPTKVKALSGLFEYDERSQKIVPIRLRHISVGSTHASAVMDNRTNVDVSKKSSRSDTNWGTDVLWRGGNEFYQLGTGKRNNAPSPVYINPPADSDSHEIRRAERRLQLTPRQTVKLAGRNVNIEQRVECGRNITAVYSAL